MRKPHNNGGANQASNRKQRTDYKPKRRQPSKKQLTASIALYAAAKRQGGCDE